MRKSKGTAYVLWLVGVFGLLGIHRFYLGKIGTGLIWIFTVGVLGTGAMIDLFTLGGQVDAWNQQQELREMRTNALAQQAQLAQHQAAMISQQTAAGTAAPPYQPPPGV